ncbi:hypothetical protein GCM10010232_15690 [Streptomyces amakusaensis]
MYADPAWINAMYPADPHAAEISLSTSTWVRNGVWYPPCRRGTFIRCTPAPESASTTSPVTRRRRSASAECERMSG